MLFIAIFLCVLVSVHKTYCELELNNEPTDSYTCDQANTTYYECNTSKRTCEDPYPRVINDDNCKNGCFCKQDYVLNEQGNCVRWKDCPIPKCGKNEEFRECSLCGRTCHNFYLNIFFKCICKPGCACKSGYVRTDAGKCVTITECPAKEVQCPDDMYYASGEIERSCENPKDGNVTNGCFCGNNFVYNRDERRCVDPSECPGSAENLKCQQEDPNKEFKLCQSPYSSTCDEMRTNNNAENCVAGCYCKAIFVENKRGNCVYYDQCKNDE